MRLRLPLAAISLGLVLSACGATNSSDTITTTAQPTRTGTVLTTPTISTVTLTETATATSTTLPAATTTAAPQTITTATITRPDSGGSAIGTSTTASAACVGSELSPSAVSPNSAPGMTVLGFILRNTGRSSCHTYGWPGVAFVNDAGSVVATLTTRSTQDDLGATPPRTFTIAPGQEASFRVTVHDAGGGTEAGCHDYSRVQIIAPDDTAGTVVTLPGGAVQACGNVSVSALEPGESATGQ